MTTETTKLISRIVSHEFKIQPVGDGDMGLFAVMDEDGLCLSAEFKSMEDAERAINNGYFDWVFQPST